MSFKNFNADSPLRVGIVADFLEERWPSMDLVAGMLARELSLTNHASRIEAEILRPPYLRPLTRFARLKASRSGHNVERALNRYGWYPLWLRRVRHDYDLFHVVDHSYAHLVNYLPPSRTIVTCHDLDTFRTLLDPGQEPRSAAFRAMVRHVLKGLRRAALVACDTRATRDALVRAGIRSHENTVVVHNGVDTAVLKGVETSAAGGALRATELLGAPHADSVEILHVGHVERRKRIDLLLRIFAGIRREFPRARLVRVGGAMTEEQLRLARDLELADAIVTLPFIERKVLGGVYRRADLLLMPSDAEGFGLPVIEALACGTQVLASDIAALREIGGDAAIFCTVGEVEQWSATAVAMLHDKQRRSSSYESRRTAGIEQSRRFSWRDSAAQLADAYQKIAAFRPRHAQIHESGTESLYAMKDVE